MYCPQCGRQIPDDSKFCPLCGAVIAPEIPAPGPSPPPEQPPSSPPPSGAPPGRPGTAKVIGAVVIIIACIVIGYALYSQFLPPGAGEAGETSTGTGKDLPSVTPSPTSPTASPTRTTLPATSRPSTTVPTASTTARPPNALFTASETTGYAPLAVSFTDDSTGFPTSWSWDFGDGTSSAQKNPTHTYPLPGSYMVRLSVTGPGGTSTSYPQLIQVSQGTSPTSVIAAFTAFPAVGTAPLTVSFIDMSTGSPASYSWEFGDGGTSSEASPAHTYTTPGQYIVRLTVRSGSGSTSTAIAPQPVVVQAPATTAVTGAQTTTPGGSSVTLAASFTYSPDVGMPPLVVRFQDASTGSPRSWYWDFGDGGSSTQRNPVHTYTQYGNFDVTLTVSDSTGSSTITIGPIGVFGQL